MTDTVHELEQRIEQIRREEQEQRETAARERTQRDVAYRRQRLAGYDRAALTKQARDAQRAFLDAVAADPVFSALADAQAARWREYRAASDAYSDAAFLAHLDGTNPPPNPGWTEPPPITTETLLNAVANLVAERVEAHQAEVDEAHAAAVDGELTREQIIEIGEAAEAERRRAAAQHVAGGSTDVTGMTEAERAARGLPPGRPPRD